MSAGVRQKVFRVPGNIVISIGLCWDFIGAEPLDLDLSAVCFTKEGDFIDVVFFNHVFPRGTDPATLSKDRVVSPMELPYMFLSGDSTIGGEAENQLPGIALAARSRHRDCPGRAARHRNAALAAESLFNRLYEEEELREVQEVVKSLEHRGGNLRHEQGGQLVYYRARREFCDEVLTFVMGKIPAEAYVVFVAVTSYTGQDLSLLRRAQLVIYNETTNEQVGTIDLRHTTGHATANLAAMLVRPAQESGGNSSGVWDLREVNVRAFGYTFVDVLPLMLDVLGVPAPCRELHTLQQLLPDYPLSKHQRHVLDQPLSDLRFGIGWDGAHDLDAFLVMLDGSNSYVDHVYPKQGRLRSALPDVARHSGETPQGTDVSGDREFIDLLTYRVPAEVRSIFIGATYMDSYATEEQRPCYSIYDVPKLYLRLQNHTVQHPNVFEVDRWEVYKEQAESGGRDGATAAKTTYTAIDHSAQPVRTLLLGVLVKKGSLPFRALFPDGRRLDQYFAKRHAPADGGGPEAAPAEEVPLFQLLPIHQHVPVDPRRSFAAVIPFLQCAAAFLWGSGGGTTLQRQQPQPSAPPLTSFSHDDGPRPFDGERHLVGWDHSRGATAVNRTALLLEPGGIGESIQRIARLSEVYAVEVRFLRVIELEPRLPDRFKCHGEAWVFSQSDDCLNRPFKTPFLVDRERLSWDATSPDAVGTFLVHQYDRIRVLLYEYAAFAYTDLDLMSLRKLWQDDGKALEFDLALDGGGPQSKAKLQLRLERVPLEEARQRLHRQAAWAAHRRSRHRNCMQRHRHKLENQKFKWCASM